MRCAHHFLLAFLLGGATALAGTAQGQTQTPGPSGTATAQGGHMSSDGAMLGAQDRDFLKNAAQGGALEIEASKLALEKASSAEVKKFAKRMIDDHQKVAHELEALAQKKGVDVPDKPSLVQKAKLETLRVRDDSFDEKYADEIGVKAHESMIKLFEGEVQDSKDADVKAFAQKVLPQLHTHLSLGKELKKHPAAAEKVS